MIYRGCFLTMSESQDKIYCKGYWKEVTGKTLYCQMWIAFTCHGSHLTLLPSNFTVLIPSILWFSVDGCNLLTEVQCVCGSSFWCIRKIAKSDYQLHHVCPSTYSHGTAWLLLDRFLWNMIYEDFLIVKEIQVWLKYDKNNSYFTWRHL